MDKQKLPKKASDKLNTDFSHLFTSERKEVIQYVLEIRFEKIYDILIKS